jgi:hypothetical protein
MWNRLWRLSPNGIHQYSTGRNRLTNLQYSTGRNRPTYQPPDPRPTRTPDSTPGRGASLIGPLSGRADLELPIFIRPVPRGTFRGCSSPQTALETNGLTTEIIPSWAYCFTNAETERNQTRVRSSHDRHPKNMTNCNSIVIQNLNRDSDCHPRKSRSRHRKKKKKYPVRVGLFHRCSAFAWKSLDDAPEFLEAENADNWEVIFLRKKPTRRKFHESKQWNWIRTPYKFIHWTWGIKFRTNSRDLLRSPPAVFFCIAVFSFATTH